MKVYTITGFEGHYPVGTAAVVRAADKEAAAIALSQALASRGLKQTIHIDDLKELRLRSAKTSASEVRILCDGNY